MSAPEVHLLFHHPIADHSFSADRNVLAVARDNNVELYKRSANKFNLQDELKGHDKTVTSVDIAPETGRIVTCSQGAMLYRMFLLRVLQANRLLRPKRIRLGAVAIGLEAHLGSFANKSSCNLCSLVSFGTKVRGRIWSTSDCGLLF